MRFFAWAFARLQLSLFVALAAVLWWFTAGCHVKSLPLPPTPSQTEVCSTMGERTRPSSFDNPTLSANKHVVQVCRFSLSAAADGLTDSSGERQTSHLDAESWNGIERSLASCLKHATGWSAAGWPANAKLQLLHGHSWISRSRRSRAKLILFPCLPQSVFYNPLSGTNESARALHYMLNYMSGSDSENDASTSVQANQHACSRFQSDIDWRHKRLSLSLSLSLFYSQKSLTYNIPGASAPGIMINGEWQPLPVYTCQPIGSFSVSLAYATKATSCLPCNFMIEIYSYCQ